MEVTHNDFCLRFTFLLVATLLLIATPASLSSAPPMAPPAPMLISPANGAKLDNGCKPTPDGITWDFDWSDVPGATAYHIRVWKNPAIPLINNMSVPSSSYQLRECACRPHHQHQSDRLAMDGAGQSGNRLGTMEPPAFLQGGKAQHRLSIDHMRDS